jgi:PAS domain S-box-containing protein
VTTAAGPQESAGTLADVIDRLDDALVTLDGACTVVYAGGATQDVLGAAPDELVGRRLAERLAVEDAAALEQLVAELTSAGFPEPVRVQVRLAGGDGAGAWREATLRPARRLERDGVLVQLRRLEPNHDGLGLHPELGARLRAMLRYSQDTVLVLDGFGRVLDVFGSHEDVGGWNREQLIGRFGLGLVHPDDRLEAGKRLLAHLVNPGRAGKFWFEARIRAADGSYRATELVATNCFRDPQIRGLVVMVRHLTTLKSAERALAESEQRFRALTERSHDLKAIVRADGTILYETPSSESVLGYSPSERVGQSILGLMHPDDTPRFRALIRALAEDPHLPLPETVFEARLRHRDGGWRYLEFTTANLIHEPAVGGIVINARDVTRRRAAETELSASRERLDTALSGAAIGIWAMDLSTGQISLDANCARLAGVGEVGITISRDAWERAIDDDDRPRARAWLDRTRTEPGVWHELEYRHHRPGAGVVWVMLRGRVSEATPTLSRRVLGIAMDIGARKGAELALRASESRLETALWSAKAAYWTIDVALDRAEMSPQFFAMTGIDPAEWALDRDPWNARMHPDDLAGARRAYEEFIAGRSDLYEAEYRLRTPSGWAWMHDRGRVVGRTADGRPAGIAGTTLDASARKELEHALSEAASHERRRLSYDLHDGLGQELAGIKFTLASIARDLAIAGLPQAKEVEAAADLVRGAMDTARAIARGLAPGGATREGLWPSLQALAHDVRRSLGLPIELHGEPGDVAALPPAGVEQIFRICQEAVANARRHGAAGRIDLAWRRENGTLEITVDDDGCGIAEPPQRGIGIGLQIMAHRARLAGGELTVARRAAGGTRVTFRGPVGRLADTGFPTETEQASQGRPAASGA